MILTHGANSLARGDFVEIGGRKYPVVKIGNQLWMAENLDWKKSGINIGGSLTYSPNAWYYNNDEATFGYDGNKFGLLYNYAAAEIIKEGLTDGWRIPIQTDWETLKQYVADDGNKLKSTQYWNTPGTNETGFNMFGSGYRGNSFGEYLEGANLRCDTVYTGTRTITVYISDSGTIFVGPSSDSDVGISIRLVKDAT